MTPTHTWKRDHRFSTRAKQAARALKVSLSDQVFNPRSVYDANQWSVEVWAIEDDERWLVISGDKRGVDAALVARFEFPCTAYDTKHEQIEIAELAGLLPEPRSDDR